MVKVVAGDTVTLHYVVKLPDDRVVESSRDGEPLRFTLGKNQVLPGVDEAVLGMEPGERKTERIPAAKAYGPWREDLLFQTPRAELPARFPLKRGAVLRVTLKNGSQLTATVHALTEDSVTFDANHPLAGKDLVFELELVAIVTG
jgi:FKBP-type peptidyl-prolyl cis-trans isomerase 2